MDEPPSMKRTALRFPMLGSGVIPCVKFQHSESPAFSPEDEGIEKFRWRRSEQHDKGEERLPSVI